METWLVVLVLSALVLGAAWWLWGARLTLQWKKRKKKAEVSAPGEDKITEKTTSPPVNNKSLVLGSVRFLLYLTAFIIVPKVVWDVVSGTLGIPAFLVDMGNGFLYVLDAAVLLFLVIAPFIAPGLKTTVKVPNHIYLLPLFADLEPGRAKAVVTAGDNPTRYVMDYAGYGFRGIPLEGESDDTRWDVVPGGVNYDARNVWEMYVRTISGLVFVGIYPWRSIKHYDIDITKTTTDEQGNHQLVVRRKESSDHVRVREFDWAIQTTVVIKGLLRITILFAFRLQSENPHKLLFGVDRWFNSFANNVSGRTTQELQNMTLEQVLTADEAQKTRVADAIQQISEAAEPYTLKTWGLRVKQVLVVKFLFDQLSDEERKALTAEAVAERTAAAALKTYKAEEQGEAGIIRARLEAMGKSPLGEAASRHAALETASAGKGTTLVFDSSAGASTDDHTKLLQAIFAELRKERKGEGV